jgi:hypothetical protein
MWVLILTILVSRASSNAATVDHVDGFETYQACMIAGGKWGDATLKRAPPGTQMTAVCVSKSGAQPVKR